MSDFQKTLLFQHLFYKVSLNELVKKKNEGLLEEPVYFYKTPKKVVKKGMILDGTKTLIFDSDFNKDIENGSIPESVKTIIFESSFYNGNPQDAYGFHKPIDEDTLPKKLEVLHLGTRFDHILMEGILPNTLRELELSDCFQQRLFKGVLPESLEKLRIQSDYPYSLKGVLPKSLKILIFKGNVRSRRFESGEIPEGIEKLKIHLHRNYAEEIPFDLIPKSVKILDLENVNRIYWRSGFFPEGIETLRLADWLREVHQVFEFKKDILPSTLKDFYMKVIGTVRFEENAIPDGVKKVSFYCHRDIHEYQRIFPDSVENLEMIMHEEREMSDVPFRYPSSLKELSISGFYKHLGELPNTIEKLTMSNIHEEIKKDYIPESVKYLQLKFVSGWNIDNLPPHLEYLETDGIEYGIDREKIPKTLNLIIKNGSNKTRIYIGRFGFERNRNEFYDAYKKIIQNEEESWKKQIFHEEFLEKMRRPENLIKWIERGYDMDESLTLMGFVL